MLVAVARNAGWVNLYIGGVGKVSTLAIASHCGAHVAGHSVGREEIGVAITTSGNYHCVSSKALELAGYQVLGNDTASTAVDNNHVVHFIAVEALHVAHLNLAVER